MAQLTFTQLPTSNPDLNRPGAGVEEWNYQNLVNVPVEGTNTPRIDSYRRYKWNHFEVTRDNYIFTSLDNDIKAAIDKGQKFGFGIMTCFPGNGVGDSTISYDGGTSVYPLYLHQLMQGESVKDWKTNGADSNTGPTTGSGYWVPNWNSQHYLTRLLALYKAINAHLETTTYKGFKFKDVIN
jgi:hypothetical protein